MSLAEDRAQVFAANRAVGRIALTAEYGRGITHRGRLHESGGLRMGFPGARARELEAVLINTAGGIAGGDRFDLDIVAGDAARLAVSSAAAEKVYRSLGPDVRIRIKLFAGAAASLAWLPQETILFDGARLDRTIDIELAPDARLVFAEAVVFGRTGMGEAVEHGLFFDRWRLRRGGALVYAESVRLDGAIAEKMGEAAVANGGAAIATLLIVPGSAEALEPLRALTPQFRGEVGTSAWNGIAVARLCAADGAALRHDLTALLASLRGGRLPHCWFH
jgi:urease accessory protein